MIFPYLPITQDIKRSIVPVLLKSKHRFIIYQALIDSGADYCIFSTEIASVLGIKLSKKKIALKGIGGGTIKGQAGKVSARIGKQDFEIEAIFAELGEIGHGILGQKGFFEHFVVKFDYSKEEIEIKPK